MNRVLPILFILISSTLLCQRRIVESGETNIFNYWEGESVLICLLSNNSPVTGIVYSEYMNGQLMFEYNLKDGKRIGWQRDYSESGQILSEVNLIDGNGTIVIKYENGRLYSEENFKNGLRHGTSKWWHENGQLSSEQIFKNGVEVSSQCWDENGKKVVCA
jgi:antitoxin component YwqK of YwqJK toxin-antitoxin module